MNRQRHFVNHVADGGWTTKDMSFALLGPGTAKPITEKRGKDSAHVILTLILEFKPLAQGLSNRISEQRGKDISYA